VAHPIRIAASLLILIATFICGSAAYAEKRVALVIGNSAYSHIGTLPNPVNDAELMACASGRRRTASDFARCHRDGEPLGERRSLR
jgi:hypothetical protein